MPEKMPRQSTAAKGSWELTAEDHRKIADAVHQAICEFSKSDGLGCCAWYAMAGTFVANTLVHDAWRYFWQAGKVHVGLTDDGKPNQAGDNFLEMDPKVTGHCGKELHCWIIRRPNNGRTGHMKASLDMEIADLSLRHFPAQAERFGVGWQRTKWPNFFWGTFAGLRDLKIYPSADPITSKQIMEDRESIVQATLIKLRALNLIRGDRLDDRVKEYFVSIG